MATLGTEVKLMMHCREVTFTRSIHKRCNVTLVFGWGMVTSFLFMLENYSTVPFLPQLSHYAPTVVSYLYPQGDLCREV